MVEGYSAVVMRMKDKNSFLIFIVVNGQNGAFLC